MSRRRPTHPLADLAYAAALIVLVGVTFARPKETLAVALVIGLVSLLVCVSQGGAQRAEQLRRESRRR